MEKIDPQTNPLDILLVEDDKDIRDTVAEVLEAEGYSVSTACNGIEGLKALRTRSHPQLVLLDLMMPEMNGWDFLKETKRKVSESGIPVIVMSAIADENVKAAGAAGYLRKPIELDHLLKIAEHHCKSCKTESKAS